MQRFRLILLTSLVVALGLFNACSGSKGNGVKLQGAGASFPAPLYLKWFKTYSGAHSNVQVDYQSVGSGSGVKSFMDRTVDFGASDAAMKPEDMAKVEGGVQLLPMTAGAIVLAYNLPELPNLRLSREDYVGIFLGKITKWNDPAVVKANPGAKLPNTPINVVVRADSSGTTFVFSKHLAAISAEVDKAVGVNTMPNWPVGTKSKGNEGVTASLLTTPGSIGYVEYGYAHSQNLHMVTLENKSGNYVAVSTDSAKASMASVPGSTRIEGPDEVKTWHAGQIWQPPSSGQKWVDFVFRRLCVGFAALTVLLIVLLVVEIGAKAIPAFREHGLSFLWGRTWDPNREVYGILPEIWGTLYTSLLALFFGSLFGVAAAVFLSEGYMSEGIFKILKMFGVQFHPFWGKLPERLELLLKNLIELLAAVPSVVYGLWGLFVVIPLIRPACNWLHSQFGGFPLFSTDLSGPGILPAVFVLSIMILPTITAISRDALVSVPPKLRMAAYGLGATRWETILGVLLPTASRGIFGGIVLAFGRALGETMALAMLVGNANRLTVSLFSPANTLAALLANSFPEAGAREIPVLMYAALVLLAITLVVNMFGAVVLERASRKAEAK